jgi:hypothetical protein
MDGEQQHMNLIPGARWACVGKKHRGLEVEVLRVSRSSVRVRPVGRWSRGQRSNVWMVPVRQFLAGHVLARVP